MRLFLLPISTRRTLIYCERVREAVGAKQPVSQRIINKAAETWAQWEKADKGWQKRLTIYGNQLFMKIPYEEWGLKSIPPATKKRLEDIEQGQLKFECLYPGAFMKPGRVPEVLKALATERQSFHKRKIWTSLACIPLTLPFTVVPMYGSIADHVSPGQGSWADQLVVYPTSLSSTFVSAPTLITEPCTAADSSSI